MSLIVPLHHVRHVHNGLYDSALLCNLHSFLAMNYELVHVSVVIAIDFEYLTHCHIYFNSWSSKLSILPPQYHHQGPHKCML